MAKKVVFYASLGNNIPAYLVGGGEIGNQRTKHIMEKAGYDVEVVDKAVFSLGLKKYIQMIFSAFCKIVRLLCKNKGAILYVVGFYERNLWFEWVLIVFARIMKHRTIYEARNGRLVKVYKDNNAIYRLLMRDVLNKADVIFCQGQEYVDFIKNELDKDSIYVPNYVLDSKLRPYNDLRTTEQINIVYFGRIVESKNICLIIRTTAILKAKGYCTKLILIGGYTEAYKDTLNETIKNLGLLFDDVVFTGVMQFDEISKYLEKSHFFLFPSQEIKEGHSNSLTEAMAFGVVPLVSTAGFSRSIVGNNELVIEEIDAEKYAEYVDDILKTGKWNMYSKYVYDRVQDLYTESCVNKKIVNALRSLSFDSKR